MSKATIFEFTSYVFEPDKKRILFNYKTVFEDRPPIFWTETIILPKIPNTKAIPKELVKKLLDGLHIMLGISYYKFYGMTKLDLPYRLLKKEADFFNIVYKKGLGEFFYKNTLDPKLLPKFLHSKNVKKISYTLSKTGKCLVGIGGGKDSIVSAELLKEAGFNITSFNIETNKSSKIVDDVIETIRAPQLKIQRFLDGKVHQSHQYNGHIPISAIYAFLGVLSAVLYSYEYIIVSNEHSSNFGNIAYKGLEINHQWSKSFEFETLFSDYVRNVISPDITYFSLLRPFYEIRIVKMFAQYRQYFSLFSSCNSNFKFKNENKTLWCNQCAKCVFAFILLSAFLPKKELLNIFGKNLYQDAQLSPLFKDVLGFGTMKPFDCVGTFEEAQTALFLAKKKFSNDLIMRQVGGGTKYHEEVFLTNKDTRIPEQFKFLGMKNAYILRYGIEGKIVQQYLKKYYPKLKIDVTKEEGGSGKFKEQKKFDIAVKTPGIKKELIKIPYTTATNIFFSKVLGQNMIIGVTGSKGKSTTSSLVYHILKTAGKDVALLGNIGTPMLGALLHPIPKNRIFVLELSSFQLDDIAFSPDIALVTNLFPEHTDFHGSLKNYYEAKKNIIRFQTSQNYFVYNSKTKSWVKNYQGKAVPFSQKAFKSNLIGNHNKSNISAAVAVAEILNIPQEKIRKAVKSFKGLPHRLENVGTFKGITFYDDAISTTPESTIMAIKALKNVDTIFLGGTDRGYNFTQLEKTIKRYNIKNVVLFPDTGNRILTSKKGLTVLKTTNMKAAVTFAYKNTKRGSICLLSCASPSYSLWESFEQKGDEFKKFVTMLSK